MNYNIAHMKEGAELNNIFFFKWLVEAGIYPS